MALLLLIAACSDDDDAETDDTETTATSQSGSRLKTVEDRGKVVCAGRTDLAGFGYLDSAGNNLGFDIDLCRAVAAAIFGNGDALQIVPITASERGPTIQAGEVDILSRNVTWTSTRDAQWGNYTVTMFYDGQGFMVRNDLGFSSALDLDGTTVCVTSGTTTELNLADFFRQNNMSFEAVIFEDTASVYGAYQEGRCDVTTSDKSQLAAIRSGFTDPDAHVILPETISKEPLTPVVAHGDDQWFDLVKTVMFVLINAEELGVTQANVDSMLSSDNIQIRRMLGAEGEFGQSDLGLKKGFAVDVIKAVGNYGEIFNRYMGPQGIAFTLPRGLNELWLNGGLIYAPPLK
ncbi:MAG: amino acid ABC transporter substrate-binding protein [Chloroflexi bacterium]|nr:amino acid ABC transporter substrate-binding protein [Chloroflexota bacterium]